MQTHSRAATTAGQSDHPRLFPFPPSDSDFFFQPGDLESEAGSSLQESLSPTALVVHDMLLAHRDMHARAVQTGSLFLAIPQNCPPPTASQTVRKPSFAYAAVARGRRKKIHLGPSEAQKNACGGSVSADISGLLRQKTFICKLMLHNDRLFIGRILRTDAILTCRARMKSFFPPYLYREGVRWKKNSL